MNLLITLYLKLENLHSSAKKLQSNLYHFYKKKDHNHHHHQQQQQQQQQTNKQTKNKTKIKKDDV